LIRARVPNGKPWHPMEGFNLTTAPETGNGPSVRCAFSDRNSHSRMPLDPTQV
jgi:hypothetical protein